MHSNFNESRRFKLILWSIVGATRGGPNRARVLNLLITASLNSHQIAKKLNLDHKTIRHHLKILTKNELIIKSTESYGATYTMTDIMKQNVEFLKEIVTKIKGN
ncbi:MAG: transcriptional regulator [Nitrosarchaeum sp.]|nr:transcriptional regulator [Nitrosarchaeum sp.]